MFNKLLITGMFLLFACGPGEMASRVQAAESPVVCTSPDISKSDMEKKIRMQVKNLFNEVPVIISMTGEDAVIFDRLYSSETKSPPETNLDEITVFSARGMVVLHFTYKGCGRNAAKITLPVFESYLRRSATPDKGI